MLMSERMLFAVENGCDACFFISDRCCRGAQLSLVSFAICQIASSERPRLEYLSSDWDWIYFFILFYRR